MKISIFNTLFVGVLSACQVTGLTGTRTPASPPPQPSGDDRAVGAGAASSSPPSSSDGPIGDDRAGGASASTHVVVPDVMGLHRRDAEATLRAAGIRGDIESGGDEMYDFAVATVCGLSPGAGSGTLSSLSISVTYCPVRAQESMSSGEPQLIGLSLEEAKKRIAATTFGGQLLFEDSYEDDAKCVVDTVCHVNGYGWWDHGHGQLTIVVYRPRKISSPR